MDELQNELENRPEQRLAQKRLAEEMTAMVHSKEDLQQAQKITDALFSGDLKDLSVGDIEQGFKDVPTYEASKAEIGLIELLVEASISSSKRQAREDIKTAQSILMVNASRICSML